jgi:hypothetical protein
MSQRLSVFGANERQQLPDKTKARKKFKKKFWEAAPSVSLFLQISILATLCAAVNTISFFELINL